MKVTAYNTFGTKESRVVISYEADSTDVQCALDIAVVRAVHWNASETRENMKVNFVGCSGMLRAL